MSRRGVTLLELMVVVAIIGIMSALAGYSMSAVNEIGRVNGASQGIANILRNARARAITERCTYLVQFNGPQYNPLAAPVEVLRTPNTIIVWRKNDCRSVVGAYVPGLAVNLRDRVVNDYNLSEFNSELVLPAGIIAEAGNRLIATSFTVSWRGDGTRMVWADTNSDGVSLDTGIVGGVLQFTVRELNGDADPNRVINVPPDGPAAVP